MRKKTVLILLLSGVLLAGSSLLNIIFSFYLGNIVQASVDLNMDLFKTSSILSILIVSAALLLEILGHNFRYRFGMQKSILYRKKLINNILTMNFFRFYKNDQSYYINQMTRECDVVRDLFFMQFPSFIECSAQILFGFSALLFISVKFTIICSIVFLLPIVVPNLLAPILVKRQNVLSDENKNYILNVKSIIEGFEVIKCNKLMRKIIHQFTYANKKVEIAGYNLSSLSNVKNSLAQFLGFLSQLVSIVIGVFLIFNGEMTMATLFAAINIIGNIVQPISSLSQSFGWVASTKDIRNKHKQLLNEIRDIESYHNENQRFDSIQVKNLSFSYNVGASILTGVNVRFEKGKKYIIKGRSGSGKSTLLKLIMGYYDNYEGEILFNDREIKDIDKVNLYNNMHMIHQNIFLFNDSLENNIFLDNEFDEELYNMIIKNTKLEELRDNLSKNGNLIVDNGAKLSGGEKQKVSIARALVRKSSILLVDEATSSLDEENANIIYEILLNMQDVTCIVVTHAIDEDVCKKFDDVICLVEGSTSENMKSIYSDSIN